MFTFSLQTFKIFFLINAFINLYYNFFDVYRIYVFYCSEIAGGYNTPLTVMSDRKMK